jgi:hypothetical protein
MYRPLGVKKATHNVFGGKALNRGLKFGAKSLGYLGDLTPVAMAVAPEVAPVLEAAKLASLSLGTIQKGRQAIKHR